MVGDRMATLEKAVILHSRKYKESSLLLTLWLREHGKLNAVARTNKKNHGIYQPFSLLNVDIKMMASVESLASIRFAECDKSFSMGSYLSQLARMYLNEVLYWLLPHDHHDTALFDSYSLVIQELVSDDITRLLRYFELQLLESLGYGFQVDHDEQHKMITEDHYYTMAPLSAFYQTTVESGISGKYIKQLQQPVSSWDNDTLQVLQKLIRINLNACLQGRVLKTRELLMSFLRNQNA